jgi:GNAT superfamily N-acetyltransferase
MRNPRETGISGITGKVLTIRRANEFERIGIADILKKQVGKSQDISGAEIVVASQEARLLGFAVLTKDAGGLSGRLNLHESRRSRGYGREVLRHLLDHSAVKHVAADRVSAPHLHSLGFERESASAGKDAVDLSNACGGRKGESYVMFERLSN